MLEDGRAVRELDSVHLDVGVDGLGIDGQEAVHRGGRGGWRPDFRCRRRSLSGGRIPVRLPGAGGGLSGTHVGPDPGAAHGALVPFARIVPARLAPLTAGDSDPSALRISGHARHGLASAFTRVPGASRRKGGGGAGGGIHSLGQGFVSAKPVPEDGISDTGQDHQRTQGRYEPGSSGGRCGAR